MPEPFTGEPIRFIECKAAFESLIGRKNISITDELQYLKKNDPVRKTLHGIFSRNDGLHH